jgi:hypothetical protein
LPLDRRLAVALVVAIATIGCGEDAVTDRGASGPVTLDLEPSAVLVSEESALIAEAVDIEVDDRGNVLVVDYRTPQVLIVPPDGNEPTVVGRGGEGPGEFRFPRAIGGAGGIVYVFDVSRGNVQPVLRNEAIPMLAANGDVWVFQQTEAVLERFDLEGARLASTQLELPEQPAILASFEERNANLGPGTTFPLRYVADAKAVGDTAWLSWNLPLGEPGVITVHGPDGRMRHRLQFPSIRTTSRFAVDAERSRLYLYGNDESSIVVIDLPEGVVS